MKDSQEVLRKKELDVKRVRREIAALHSVIPLLAEPSDWAEYGLALPPSLSQVQEVRTASGKTVREAAPGTDRAITSSVRSMIRI